MLHAASYKACPARRRAPARLSATVRPGRSLSAERTASGRLSRTPRASQSALLAISCPSSTNCTVVGEGPPRGLCDTVQLIERWTGAEWSVQRTPSLGTCSTATAYYGSTLPAEPQVEGRLPSRPREPGCHERGELPGGERVHRRRPVDYRRWGDPLGRRPMDDPRGAGHRANRRLMHVLDRVHRRRIHVQSRAPCGASRIVPVAESASERAAAGALQRKEVSGFAT